MSGIYIKGLKMPDKCINCFFNDIGTECGLLEHDVEDAILRGKRYGGCPLLPVPDHGDLIDRDALIDSSPVFVTASFGKSTEFISRYKVNNAPVVIPEERSE